MVSEAWVLQTGFPFTSDNKWMVNQGLDSHWSFCGSVDHWSFIGSGSLVFLWISGSLVVHRIGIIGLSVDQWIIGRSLDRDHWSFIGCTVIQRLDLKGWFSFGLFQGI